MRRARRVALVVFVLAVGAVVLLGLPPRPAPLPPGVTPLALLMQPAPLWRFPIGGCPAALLVPVRVERDGDAMAFVAEADGKRIPVRWPAGFSARLLDGRAELVTPGGRVFARDGEVLRSLGGGTADNGDALVCFGSPMEYEWGP
jgi:hypothetical protein